MKGEKIFSQYYPFTYVPLSYVPLALLSSLIPVVGFVWVLVCSSVLLFSYSPGFPPQCLRFSHVRMLLLGDAGLVDFVQLVGLV